MTELASLSPQSRAVLSLVLVQGKSFEAIAGLLRMETADVRARAHAAAFEILPASPALEAEARGAVVDYLLGQDSVSARMGVRRRLRDPGEERDWAMALSQVLEPFAREPLPAIPELGEDTAPRVTTRARRPRRLRWLAGLLILCAAGAGIVVVLAAGGPKHAGTHRGAQAGRATSRPTPQHPARAAVQTIKRLVLVPASAAPTALGAGAIVRQGGSLLLLVQARGLAANRRDSYAVWLFNTPVDARLLGLVAPPVGPAGTFSSGVALPDDAIRFHTLLVTRETSTRPGSPGPTVLHGPLSLS